jgi:shikimate 5-dehydrogenase
LRSLGASVEVAARRREAAEALADALGVRSTSWPPGGGWDVLVNTTPAGMWPNVEATPIEARCLAGPSGRVVYDMVYNPHVTTLLRDARAAGATTIGGLEMLVGQACEQFTWWTGHPAPRETMAAAAENFLKTDPARRVALSPEARE